MKMFDPTRPVKTVDGRKVRITTTDSENKLFPITALVENPDDKKEYSFRYTIDGKHNQDGSYSDNDLINVDSE